MTDFLSMMTHEKKEKNINKNTPTFHYIVWLIGIHMLFLQSLYNWVGFGPLYNLNNQVSFDPWYNKHLNFELQISTDTYMAYPNADSSHFKHLHFKQNKNIYISNQHGYFLAFLSNTSSFKTILHKSMSTKNSGIFVGIPTKSAIFCCCTTAFQRWSRLQMGAQFFRLPRAKVWICISVLPDLKAGKLRPWGRWFQLTSWRLVWSFHPHDWQGFVDPRWCRISSINSMLSLCCLLQKFEPS